MNCGCKVTLPDWEDYIVYCPLHDAAGEMLEALKALDLKFSHEREGFGAEFQRRMRCVDGCRACMVEAAIARAEPKLTNQEEKR